MTNKLISFVLLLFPLAGHAAAPKRISSVVIDTGVVKPFFMVVGLGTVLTFPANVTDAFAGDAGSVKYQPLGNSKNQLRLSLANSAARSTNLFVWTGEKQYVFDIVVSKSIHQDSLKVVGSYEGVSSSSDFELVESSSPAKKKRGRLE